MRLTGPFKIYCGVINDRGIEVVSGENRYCNDLVVIIAVDRIRVAAGFDVDVNLDWPSRFKLEGTNVTGGTLGPGDAALVCGFTGIAATAWFRRVTRIDGRTTLKQGMCFSGAAIIL
jgi:hypothetical protein